MSPPAFDLVVVGELNPDAIVLAEEIDPEYGQVETLVEGGTLTIGSSGAIVACGAATLGMRTAYVGVAGEDAAGRFMLGELDRRGVDVDGCRLEPGMATGLSVILSRGDDRAILTALGAMGELRSDDVSDQLLAATGHLHLSSPHLQLGLLDGIAELFGRAHAAGASTSLDPGWDPNGGWSRGLDAALEATDVFLPNAAEACRFAGTDDPADALERLADRLETVVVKLGSEGAIARRGTESAAATAPAVDFVDATGAGDSFTAGFLYGAGSGRSLEETLRLATACGSLSTRSLGGVAAQPRIDEAMALAGRSPPRKLERSGG